MTHSAADGSSLVRVVHLSLRTQTTPILSDEIPRPVVEPSIPTKTISISFTTASRDRDH